MLRRRAWLHRASALTLALTLAITGALSLDGGSPPAPTTAAQGIKGGGEPRTLRVIHFSVPPILTVAKDRGFFAAQNLQVENITTQSSQQLMQGVVAGTYDIGCTNADNWIAYVLRDDADVFLFQGATQGENRSVVMRPEIQSPEDLRGRALAVDAVDSGLVMILWRILAEHGVDFRTGDPSLIPVGTTSLRLDSMERGETFAAIVSPTDLDDALRRGFRVLGESRDYLPEYPAPDCGTSRRWAVANEDALVRYIRAWIAATDWALHPANREEAMAIYMRESGASRPVAEARFAEINPTGAINIPGIQTILDLRTALGFLPGTGPLPPIQRFYDTRYWERATGRPHP